MLINRAIANLFQGISQQPASIRLPTQAEYQVNGLSTIVEGLKKRPPSTHVAKLQSATATNGFVHFINRDNTERYTLIIDGGDLKVYDLAGTAMTVNFPSGKGYLSATTPRSDFAALTINDYTFIVNKTVTVTQDSAAAGWDQSVAYVYCSYGAHSTEYKITVDGTTGSYTSAATTSSQAVASNLATALGTALGAGYTVTNPYDSIIKIKKNSGNLTSLGVSDGYGNQSLKAVFKQVQNFNDLPPRFDTGYVVKIQGQANESAYYVTYDTTNGTGVWKEVVCPGLSVSLTDSTMPWKLVRTGTNTFSFDKVTWIDRASGDDTSNPFPSFLGRTISDVFFHRNRLGFTAAENVVLSQSGDFFNFFSNTATALLDSDPIDIAITSTKPAAIKNCTSFNSTLLIFTDNGQFQLTTPNNTALTPKSVTVNPTTQYQVDNTAKPVSIGQDVYFLVSRGNYTGVMEYFVQPLTYTNEASDVTAHVPKYIPVGVYKLIGSSIYDVLFAFNTTSRNQIHIYKFYWGEDDKKAQSSWSHWEFTSTDVILGGEMIDSKLYLAVQRSDGIFLEYMDIQAGAVDTGMGVNVHLDRKVYLTGSYSSGTGLTTWTLPYQYSGTVQVVLGSGWGTSKGRMLTVSRPSNTTVTAVGDYSTYACYVGVPYSFIYTLSPFYFKDEKNVNVEQYALKMKDLNILYATTGYLKVLVTPYKRDTYTYYLTGNQLGTTADLGEINTQSGALKVPLFAGNDGLTVQLINDSWLPSYLQSAEWNAKVSYLFRRM